MRLEKFLGCTVVDLLAMAPFKNWDYIRSVDMDVDPPSIDYEFPGHGFDVTCDLDERIRAVFLMPGEVYGSAICEIPFNWDRGKLWDAFGVPVKQGEESVSSILGPSGAWDRFSQHGFTVHIEYKVGSDRVNRITFIRNDAPL